MHIAEFRVAELATRESVLQTAALDRAVAVGCDVVGLDSRWSVVSRDFSFACLFVLTRTFAMSGLALQTRFANFLDMTPVLVPTIPVSKSRQRPMQMRCY